MGQCSLCLSSEGLILLLQQLHLSNGLLEFPLKNLHMTRNHVNPAPWIKEAPRLFGALWAGRCLHGIVMRNRWYCCSVASSARLLTAYSCNVWLGRHCMIPIKQ